MVLAVSDVVWTALIVAVGAPAAALLAAWQLNRQRRAEKAADNVRLDEVAAAERQRAEDLAASNAKVAETAARGQAEVAAVARDAAKLLLDAQTATTSAAEEVARVAADKPAQVVTRGKLLAVVISHPSGLRREILLDGIPSKGEHILLRNSQAGAQPSRVADVMWVEANGGESPSVIVVVCPIEDKPAEGLMKTAEKAL